MDILVWIQALIATIFNALVFVYSFLYAIPVIGQILALIYLGIIVWVLSGFIPASIKRFFWARTAPATWSLTRMPRNALARRIGDADIFRQSGDPAPPPPKRVRVFVRPKRRRWFIAGILIGAMSVLAIQNREALWPYFERVYKQ